MHRRLVGCRLRSRRSAGFGAVLAAVVVGLAACSGAAPGERVAAGLPERPNIVFIYTDDQASWALGLTGHPQLRTPNLDRLARQGAYLPNAFTVTPVCSPSRAELLTGRYGSEIGILEWISTTREPEHGLDPTTVTWVERLDAAGYATGLVGKWHLGIHDRYHPTRMGYDYFMGFRTGGLSPGDPVLEADGEDRPFEGYIGDILTDQALDFIRRHRGEPFLLSLHYRAPHRPWLPMPEEDWAPYRNLDPQIPNPDYPKLDVDSVKTITRQYLASTASVDRNVGRVLDLLDALDLADHTVVIFTSDHGYSMGHNGIWHKGNGYWILTEPPPGTENVPAGQRPNMYDTALKVPTMVRWPGKITPGTVVEETVTNLDWYPTLLEMTGLAPQPGKILRGRSMLPLLQGEAVEGWDDDVYGEYTTYHEARAHMRMYRTSAWKLVRDFLNPARDELYHLAEDPGETTNLIDDPRPEVRAVVERLHAKILDRMRTLNDPVLSLAETDR